MAMPCICSCSSRKGWAQGLGELKAFSRDNKNMALQGALLAAFAALFFLKIYTTLEWRMEHDTPLLNYAAFLMHQHGLVPYRDFFETSMPGTFAFHYALTGLFGYGDAAFRYVDLTLLCALLVASYLFMRRFGHAVAAWGAILFGLIYLSKGQVMSLQRDYIGIIPVAFSLLTIPAATGASVPLARFALAGLLFGMSVTIKPHLGIAFPVVFGALYAFRSHSQKECSIRDFLQCVMVSLAFLLMPMAIALVWLASNSALASFLDMVFQYLPLHSAMNGDHMTISGVKRANYVVRSTFMLGGYVALFVCSLLGFYLAWKQSGGDRAMQISIASLTFCTLAYAIYPAPAGKFWPYHYMPLAYFCAISAGLCLFGHSRLSGWWAPVATSWRSQAGRLLPVLALVIAVSVQLPLTKFLHTLSTDLRFGPEVHAPKWGDVDEIANWLKSRIKSGDTIQPLDWADGGVHAMLLVEARLATHFLYEYHFYHHISSPYIQSLRQSFITQLYENRPRFIVKIRARMPWGEDTTSQFHELQKFMSDNYVVARAGKYYLIYERMDGG